MMDDENLAHSSTTMVGALIFPCVILFIIIIAASSESNTVLMAGLLAIPGLFIGFLVTKLVSLFVIKKVEKAGEDFDKTNRS